MLNVFSGFMSRGDIMVADNASIHYQGKNSDLHDIFSSVGIDLILLPTYSLELNPIELVFNIVVQLFTLKFNEMTIYCDNNAINLLAQVANSISPETIFSYYTKCGCTNF